MVPWKWPRKIVFANGEAFVTALGSWKRNEGQVWKIDLSRPSKPRFQLLFDKTDRSHGLELGPDGWIYFGDATAIYKFNPKQPSKKVLVIGGLPDSYIMPDGEVIPSNHPLTDFVFLKNRDLVVNVGAPSNNCSKEYIKFKECAQRDRQAELRLFKYDPQRNTYSERPITLARGLRNSMGLIQNDASQELYQLENGADGEGTPDELNLIPLNEAPLKPLDFGWPFCFGNGSKYNDKEVSYQAFRTFCSSIAQRPLILLPAHAAPLDGLYYEGDLFPQYRNQLLMVWHGHRDSGSRLVTLKTDNLLRPMGSPEMIIDGWLKKPKGRPSGIGIDSAGAIFITDDQNNSLVVLAPTSESRSPELPDDKDLELEDLDQIFSKPELLQWDHLFQPAFVRTGCFNCHSEIVSENSSRKTLTAMIKKGWIRLEEPRIENQILWYRINGLGGKIMPPVDTSPSLVDLAKSGDPTLGDIRAWFFRVTN